MPDDARHDGFGGCLLVLLAWILILAVRGCVG